MNKLALALVTSLYAGTVLAQTVGSSGTSLIGQDSTNKVITTAVPFLMITPDSRAAGMGDAGVATSPDGNSAHWNAAKLVFIDKGYGVSASYTPWLGKIINDMSIFYLSGFYKLNNKQVIAASMKYFNLGEVQFNQGPDPADLLGRYNPREFAFDVTYSTKLTEQMSIGGSLRYIHSNLTGYLSTNSFDARPGNSVAVDFGMYYNKPIVWKNSNLAFGATITNLGGKISYSDANNKDFLPTNLRIGSAYRMEINQMSTLAFALDFNKLMVPSPAPGSKTKPMLSGVLGSFTDAKGGLSEELAEITTSLGMEYWYNNTVAARLGYFYEAKDKGNRKYLTAGLGVRYEKFGLDVAYLVPTNKRENALAETLRFTLMMVFKQKEKGRRTRYGLMAYPDRTQAPDFQLSTDYSLAQPEQFHSGTVPVFAFRQISQEAVRIELLFDAGKWHEPGPGISHFASQLLSKGTRHRNAFAVAEGFESLGAHLEVSPGYDITTVALFALRKNVVEAMKLLREVLTEPAFDEEELRIMKEIFLQNLRVQNEKTSVVASKEIRRAIFGGSHPYGSSLEEHHLTGLGTIALRDYYQKHFKLRAVFIVGRLNDQVLREVMHLLPPSPPIVTPSEHIPHPGRSLTLPRENSVQASIRLGALFPQKQHSAEHFATVLVNHILGGFFGSRLMKNIREEKGLTYGIYSSINHFERSSCWIIGAEVNQQNADQALVEIRKEIEVLRSVAVPMDELENARNYFIGSWQSENATLFSVSDKIKGLFLAGLTPAYYTDLLRFVSSCSSAQLLEAAHHHFDPARLIEVRVG